MLALMTCLTACLVIFAQNADKETLRKNLKDAELPASWIYDDIAAGLDVAKKTSKPMLVVFR